MVRKALYRRQYRLFYEAGEPDSTQVRAELRDAGVPVSLVRITKDLRVRLTRDYGIKTFPALICGMACWQGLEAIRDLIRRKAKK